MAGGGTVLDPEVVAQLLCAPPQSDRSAALTPREREVLALMAEGRSNRAIAARLVVTEGAVEKHVTSIFVKLGLQPAEPDHRRVLAVLAYLRGSSSSAQRRGRWRRRPVGCGTGSAREATNAGRRADPRPARRLGHGGPGAALRRGSWRARWARR